MSERFVSDLERNLASSLEPVRAPESLWYRVDAELSAPRPERGFSLSRLALACALVLVSVVSAGWYFDRPSPTRATPVTRGQHTCVVCHS